ncbi:carboxymuconolactone decarboxylase family protein [Cereibacter sphaeroides]|jgi:AhpD family alkylhydroperoxidase|uniref:carboxymuconolactone decarboxylase family protein n=1 Tax=Cereibacter sphaeroides TaxID=1063 RepID=UPI000066559E|nr:alkylhydroperoxidase like protein, AhpD family [Cereibacter sphaeroides ATCC 17029]
MTPRMTDHFKRIGQAFQGLVTFETELRKGPLEPALLHLVKMRASQINGCAFCLQIHASEALKDGETHLRLHMLAGWQDSSLFSPRERAALAWTEAVTLIDQSHTPDADWEALRAEFSEDEAAYLTFAIAAINLWNRTQIAFRVAHAAELPAERARVA